MEPEGSVLCSLSPLDLIPSYIPLSTLSHITYLRSVSILYSYLLLGLPNVLSHDFSNKTLYEFLNPPLRATLPAHLTFLHLITLIKRGKAHE